jgi:lysophospholipase L1-like esterase
MTQPEVEYFLKLQKDWIGRILERYSGSSTAIVLTPVPRSPSGGMLGVAASYQSELPNVTPGKTAFLVPPRTFDFLEKPEYYFDNYHLNAKGRQLFTERLVAELLGWMRSADARDYSGADSKPLMGKSP